MATTTSYNKIFSKANLYFAGTTIVLIVAMVMLLILLKNQNIANVQVKNLINMSDSYRGEITKQQAQLKKLSSEVSALVPNDANALYGQSLKLTDITRYFDKVATDLRRSGQAFSISTISYTEDSGTNDFIGATLAIQSTESNLVQFLRQIETSGIADKPNNYLMELRSFTMSLGNTASQGDQFSTPVYSVSIGVKIYAFEPKADDLEITPEEQALLDPNLLGNLPL